MVQHWIAAEQADLTLAGAWMVGDSAHHDILGAQRLGLKTAWVARSRTWNEPMAQPDLIPEDLTSLAEQLSQLGA